MVRISREKVEEFYQFCEVYLVRISTRMFTSCSLCILILVFLHGSSSQDWPPILEPAGGALGNLGLLHTNSDKSTQGGYMDGDYQLPALINGNSGSFQGNSLNDVVGDANVQGNSFNDVGGDTNVRFPVDNLPLYGMKMVPAHTETLTPRLNLGADVNKQFGGGLSSPDLGAGLSLKYRSQRKRRAIACFAKCDNACRRSSNECVGDCIVRFC